MRLNKYITFDEYNVDDEWGVQHRKWIPVFIKMTSEGRAPSEWEEGAFYEFFYRRADQCVSSLRQGMPSGDELQRIEKEWSASGLKDLFQQIATEQDNACWKVYEKIDNAISTRTNKHYAAFIARLIAAIQPKVFTTVVSWNEYSDIVWVMKQTQIEGDYDSSGDILEKSYKLMKFLKSEYPNENEIDVSTIGWKIRDVIYKKNEKMKDLNEIRDLLLQKKQIILQGAPGTGKTYQTAQLALATIGVNDIDLFNHGEVMKRYNQLRDKGQIGFVTFHLSMDYEDFVEGIKPSSEDGEISYEVESGIFKKMCEDANLMCTSNFDSAYQSFLKDISDNTVDDPVKLKTSSGKVFGVCPNSKGNLTLLTGTDLHSNGTLTKENINRYATKGKLDSWTSYFRGVTDYLLDKYQLNVKAETERKNYVLIIDEINRGNVSKIFGELITLIEADKRLKQNQTELDHSLTVELPYSKEPFGVPDNLYIIGTMNTTDRSVGSLDYALRRRFAFVTIESRRDVIEEFYKKADNEELGKLACERWVKVKEFLNSSKQDMDIEDLMVGHSYFMAPDKKAFDMKWKYEVLPLLDEYYKDGIISKKWDNSNL